MSRPERKSRPRAFRLNGDETISSQQVRGNAQSDFLKAKIIETEEDVYAREAIEHARLSGNEIDVPPQSFSHFTLNKLFLSWGGLFISAFIGLTSLIISAWAWSLIEELFLRSHLLGVIGLTLLGIITLCVCVFLGREVRSLLKQNKITTLHNAFTQAYQGDDVKQARACINDLCKIYVNQPETARARALMSDYCQQIINGRDLIDLAERNIVALLDTQAQQEIATAAKRVSVVTAISPRAIFDVLFVTGQAVMLMRRIAEIYGGRPGLLGFFKLARSVGAHLAVTGAVAVGDTLMQQIVGHGLASRVSAKLGEGFVNGLLTARVGLSAMLVCRPMNFTTQKQPSVGDVAPFLFRNKDKS